MGGLTPRSTGRRELTADERARRERCGRRRRSDSRKGASDREVATRFRVTRMLANQWRRALAAGGPAGADAQGPGRGALHAQPHPAAVAGCLACSARVPCLAYAVAADERHGVWGATTPEQRRQLVRDADAA